MNERRPRLSVVVPAYQGKDVLPLSLSALLRSDLPRDQWELIVVDDASRDETAMVAARFADTVVRLPVRPLGPAYARNRGVEVSQADIVVFVDADVCVHTETLRRILAVMDENPGVSALFGSYDSAPADPSFVSDFRNLLHHYVHHRDAGDAETFWAGCGAVRTAAFRQVGMFDEWHYPRPQIEDIELGRRLRQHGHRIMLRPEIQGTHLKKWTLKDVMLTDFRHRGMPWTQLLLQEGPNAPTNVLNIRASEKVCTAFAGLGWLAIAAAIFTTDLRLLLVLPVLVIAIIVLNRDLYRFIARIRGIGFAIAMVPLHLMYYATNVVSAFMGWLHHILLGEPQAPVNVVAGVGMDLTTWPPRPSRPRSGVWGRQEGQAETQAAARPATQMRPVPEPEPATAQRP